MPRCNAIAVKPLKNEEEKRAAVEATWLGKCTYVNVEMCNCGKAQLLLQASFMNTLSIYTYIHINVYLYVYMYIYMCA